MTELGEAHHQHGTIHGMSRKKIEVEGNIVGYPASHVCSLESIVRSTESPCMTISPGVLMEEKIGCCGSQRGRETTTESS
jgi:hypothetical protein